MTGYKVINNENTVIGKLGFAILVSDKKDLKMILYKSKTDLLSTLIVRETNKIFQKGKFIQYLDKDQNFWSVLFETDDDLEEAVRLLEERCTIERLTLVEKMPQPTAADDDEKEDDDEATTIATNDVKQSNNENHNNHHFTNEGENYVKDKEGELSAADDVAASTGASTKHHEKAETDSAAEDKSSKLKSNILTRMAKMGKRIVSPSRKLTTNNTELSDSSDPEVSPRRKVQQQQQQRPHTTHNSPALQVAKLQPGPIAHSIEFIRPPPTSSALMHHHNHNSMHSAHHSSGPASASDSSLNLMLMQNTEIRFNLSKLDSKLEKLCDKIESMSASNVAATISSTTVKDTSSQSAARASVNSGVDEDMIRMEAKLLSLKRENINLKSIIRNMEAKLDVPPDIELNELKIELKTAQLENKNISLDLDTKSDQIVALQTQLKATRDELDAETSSLEVELNELRSQLTASTRHSLDLQHTVDLWRQQRDSSLTAETQTEQETVAFSEASIKEIMNSLYFKLCEKISSSGSAELKQSEVLKIIGQTIKQETSESLKKHFK